MDGLRQAGLVLRLAGGPHRVFFAGLDLNEAPNWRRSEAASAFPSVVLAVLKVGASIFHGLSRGRTWQPVSLPIPFLSRPHQGFDISS